MSIYNAQSDVDSAPSTSTGRTHSYENITIDHQYLNLVKYVKKLKEPFNSQLTKFLFPLFFHVYKDLLSRKKADRAQKLILHDCKSFLGAGCYKLVNNELSKIRSVSEFTQTSYFKQFCESEHTFDFSDEALKNLLEYLKEKRYRRLLFIVLFNFKLMGNSGDSIQAVESADFRQKEASSSDFETDLCRDDSSVNSNERRTYYYSVQCKNQNICAVDINPENTFLACGFENASIHLWQIDVNDFRYTENNEIRLGLIVPRDFSHRSKRLKSSACKGADVMLRGHKGSVYGMKFTNQHNILMSCSEDCTVKAWALGDYKVLGSWGDQKYPIWDVAVSLQTDFFATACKYLADIWNFDRTRCIQSFAGHTADVDCVRIHANGKYLATASADKTIKIWDLRQKVHVRQFNVGNYISTIEFSANGKYLVSADDFGNIKIYDINSEKMIKEMECAHSGRITSVSCNSSNTLLATGGFDETLKIWDISRTGSSDSETNNARQNDRTLVDSQPMNSELQYVNFRKPDLVLSVATPKQPELDDIVQFL